MAAPPPTERWAFLRTRLGRRLFTAFVWATLTPIGVLALLSWNQVGEELREQSRNRLHQAARASGMRVIEKFDRVEAQLADLPFEDLPPRALEHLADSVSRLEWRAADGSLRTVMGAGAEPDVWRSLPPEGVALATGESVDGITVWLMVAVGASGAGWAAELDANDLFDHGPTNVLPVAGEFCVESGRRRLGCSFADVLPLPDGIPRQGVPVFEVWTIRGEDHLGVRWPLFLRARYDVEDWTVSVSEPRAVALAAASTFRALIPPSVLLTVLIAALVTALQIRRQLVPLERLTEGTRRIAEGDFSFHVEVAGEDEFAQLATAFSAMTTRIASQFDSMEQLIEIDRRILSCQDPDELLEISLVALAALHPAPRAAIQRQAPRETAASLVEQVAGRVNRREIEMPPDSSSAVDLVSYRVIDARLVPEAIGGGVDPALATAVQFPLRVGTASQGCLWMWLRSPAEMDTGKYLLVSQFASQLAAAIHGLQLRAEADRLLNFDGRTGLANLVGIQAQLRERILGTVRPDELLVVAEISLSGLSRVERTIGGVEADALIRRLADIVVSEADAKVGRPRDDAIVAVFDAAERSDIQPRLVVIERALREELENSDLGHAFDLTTGVAVHPMDGESAEVLLQKAGDACRHAVESGSSRTAFFSAAMRATAEARLRIERDLATAAARDEFRLFYQPIVAADSLEIVAAEALVRWEHPERGLIPPDEFIPIAEESGLIHGIGSWVLRKACEDIAAWSEAGLPEMRISVNVANAQIQAGSLLSEVRSALATSGASPSSLGIELTESSLLSGDLATLETISAIRRVGVAVSLDDFGTGYSSLAYLRRLPVDVLKLDRSFLEGVPEDDGASLLVDAVIAMARALRMSVVAEGVETRHQLEFLRGLSCDRIQGYLFSAPLPEPAFREFIEKGVDFD